MTTKPPRRLAGAISLRYVVSPPAIARTGDFQPLIQWDRCRYDCIAKPADDSPYDHQRKCTAAFCSRLHSSSNARHNSASESSISPSKTITDECGQEDITNPCTQVVDCCYETYLRGRWLGQRLNEAGRDIHGREDTDVVSANYGEYDTKRSPEDTS
jgi:hypothetical protein